MRRPLALLAVVTALAAPSARAGEPLDLDLARLGAPSAAIWKVAAPTLTDAQAAQLAADARIRFARLATDLALAFSSSLLQPAATTGASGFAFDLEGAYTAVGHEVIGSASYPVGGGAGAAYPRDAWPTRSKKPSDLFTPSVHVRKAFPFSVELGGRFTYLSQSSYFAAQLEGKVALVEGYLLWPDVAVRGAYQRLLGQRDLSLGTTELDLLVSKRFGVNAVTSLTPYLALRLLRLDASSDTIYFGPSSATADPATIQAGSGAFPKVTSSLYRTTLGLRLTSFAVSLAAEGTWFAGGSQGTDDLAAANPKHSTPSSFSAAAKLGFLF